MVAYPGSYHYRAGKRTAQRYTYSPYFPVLEYDTTQGAFFGGNFWDGRSTGYNCRARMPSRHSTRRSTLRKWAFLTRPASRFGCPWRCIGPFSSDLGCGFRHPIGRPTPGDLRHPGRCGNIRRQRYSYCTQSGRPHQGEQRLRSLGTVHLQSERSTVLSPFTSKFDAFLKGNYTYAGRDGRVRPVQRQRQLQFLSSRRKIDDLDAEPDRHRYRGQYEAPVHLLRLCQSRPAAQSQGRAVLSDHAG